jgi:hypothetical protein
MDLIVEPSEYAAYLFRVSLVHDNLVVRDAVENVWQITQDEIDRFWAASIAMRNGSVLPAVHEATTHWFLNVRPLLVLWKPGTWPLL